MRKAPSRTVSLRRCGKKCAIAAEDMDIFYRAREVPEFWIEYDKLKGFIIRRVEKFSHWGTQVYDECVLCAKSFLLPSLEPSGPVCDRCMEVLYNVNGCLD